MDFHHALVQDTHVTSTGQFNAISKGSQPVFGNSDLRKLEPRTGDEPALLSLSSFNELIIAVLHLCTIEMLDSHGGKWCQKLELSQGCLSKCC